MTTLREKVLAKVRLHNVDDIIKQLLDLIESDGEALEKFTKAHTGVAARVMAYEAIDAREKMIAELGDGK